MNSIESTRAARSDFALAAAIIAVGLIICGVSLMQFTHPDELSALRSSGETTHTSQLAQNTPTIVPGKENGPAESKPGGTRPTTPAPEPARPDADAQKAGAQPALPPAPAEKIGEPVQK